MVDFAHLDPDSNSLRPLPSNIHPWLRAVVTLGFLSFICSVTLFLTLGYRLIQWQLKSKRTNQFVILIFNLVWADIQQSLAFLLNVEWLRLDALDVNNPVCFAQGWFISTGDLASGIWCFTIGLHTFASVILDYRLKPRCFFQTVAAIWIFIYVVTAIPVMMYGVNAYVRAGVWCWIHHDLADLRLWTHYVWIFFCEFGNVFTYAIIYTILIQRIRSGYYTAAEAERVKSISNLMVVYPIVYVICTLPLASARMASMSGYPPSLTRLCLCGAMITSNGWLDVLLYTLTRRVMLFSDEPPADNNGLDTFSAFWAASQKRFGAAATCEAEPARNHHYGRRTLPYSHENDSENDLCGRGGLGDKEIKLVTTTHITSEPAQLADLEAMEIEARKNRPRTPTGRYSEESFGQQKELQLELEHIPD
ncbi:integral membrane protein-like protein [Lophiotrema nucula]|uniref:Integral membrane protein-like protein n=1 Tax=Lophiotrema nucula TaxID=690887 RepID=A0A6A5YSN4_9PLEO|nr:integral membrane protein-like protein [Lophiotrema nucula]